MQEYTAQGIGEVDDRENLADMIFANAERFPTSVSFRKRNGHAWVDVTTREFAEAVTGVAKGLIETELQVGDRVGLLSKTRYEWNLLDFAIWTAGGVTVPIYDTSSAEQAEWILSDSGAKALIVETDAHRSVVDGVVARLGTVEHVWQIEGQPGVVRELTETGTDVPEDRVRERRRTPGADDLATLVYTSGTTGRPKGCVLTHRNLLAQVRVASNAFPQLMAPGNSQLIFLPLAHVLARSLALTCIYTRLTIGHTPDVGNLVEDLRSFRPTFVVAVPRVFEKVYNSAKQQAHDEGPLLAELPVIGDRLGKLPFQNKGWIFDKAEATAVAYSKAENGGGPSFALRAQHLLFDRLVYGKLRAALGGRCIGAVSGGAPLGERLAHFFRGIGVPVYEGYGLTETSSAATVNTEAHSKVGTVGRPVAGHSVRIAEDGEVLLRGDVIFRGYWHNEEATEQALAEGWYHTGDLGSLDSDGYLRITGRKKELIVTAGGKNVAPAVLEDGLRAHPLVSQCMIVGDQQPFVAALITVDEEFFAGWKQRNGKPADATVESLLDDPALNDELQSAVDEANKAVSHAEAIKQFRVLPNDFTIDSGELTPSLKLKRNVVADQRGPDIKAIYH